MGAKVSVLLKNVDPVFLEQCKSIRISENLFVENRDYVSHISVADVMKTDKFELVIAKITCQRITDILSYYNYVGKQSERPANSINFNCKDVSIINTAGDRLVVANDLKNILIANTKDAVYITRKDSKTGIKEISRTYYQDKRKYFDDYPVYYQDWGVEETLSSDSEYRVAKITVYPKCAMEEASSASEIVNFFVLDGSVETITAKVKDKGSVLLNYTFGRSFAPIEVNMKNTKEKNGSVQVSKRQIENDIQKQLIATTALQSFDPQQIDMDFSQRVHKEIPVVFNGDIHLEAGFQLSGISESPLKRSTLMPPRRSWIH